MTQRSVSDADSLLPLSTPVVQILLSLTESDLHGYAIIGDIVERTGGDVHLSTSTLYGAIKRMMRDGLVEEAVPPDDVDSDDERRRYYKMTPFGAQVLQREALRIQRLAAMVSGKQFTPRTS